MTYVDHVRRLLLAELPSLAGKPGLLDHYVLLALTRGGGVDMSDVHDAWSVWRSGTNSEHPDIHPFGHLDRDTQEKDRKYAESIARVAEKFKATTIACDRCRANYKNDER